MERNVLISDSFKASQWRRTPATSPVAAIIDGMSDRSGLSINRLAHMVFVDHAHVSRIRRGDKMPSVHLVLQMATHWPLTEEERVALCEHFSVIPPGYRVVRAEGVAA